MSRTFTVQMTSALMADRRTLLDHIGTLEGVNLELRPLLRMTLPRRFRGTTLYEVPTGEWLFRSWLLLGGVLPIDYDHLRLESVDPESGFIESSSMLSMRVWRHERRIQGLADVGAARSRSGLGDARTARRAGRVRGRPAPPQAMRRPVRLASS